MSLINQMLKDLEQRGAGSNDARNTIPRNLSASKPKSKPLPTFIIVSFALLLIAGIYFWMQEKVQSLDTTITKNDVVKVTSEPYTQKAPVTAVIKSSANEPYVDQASNEVETYKPAPLFEKTLNLTPIIETEIALKKIAENEPEDKIAVNQQNTIQSIKADVTEKQDDTSAVDNVTEDKHQKPVKDVPKPLTKSSLASPTIVKNIRDDQKSNHYYHLALANLQQGRVSEAQANLTRALEIDPTNHEARQTLASLLLDNKRHHDAITILATGLNIAPEQNDFRMALARLQVEANDGAGALTTLEQGLAYAKNDADFQSFIATLLQRAARHEEAINHYKSSLALKSPTPNNTTNTLIGLGISLQATHKLKEAKLAFTSAQTSQTLSQEVSIFVAQQLKQIDQRLSQ